jgi:hypothetical protein
LRNQITTIKKSISTTITAKFFIHLRAYSTAQKPITKQERAQKNEEATKQTKDKTGQLVSFRQ